MSRIFLRAKDTLSLSSDSDPKEPSSSMTSRTLYPPETTPSNEFPHSMASSRPHPYRYQPAALFSPVNEHLEIDRVSIPQVPQDTTTSSNHNTEKPAIGHLQPLPLPPRTPSRRHRLPLPLQLQLRPIILLLVFLPIPPLLSLLYMAAGHAILRQNHTSSTSIYHAPILSSVEAGATGGVILSLPIALVLYLLIFPSTQSPVPEDFFEDDDSLTIASVNWMLYAGYVVCIFSFVGIGGVAGPLGVTCLSSGVSDAFIIIKKMLSTGAAAAAGFVGGVVLSAGILLLSLLTTLLWSFWVKRHKSSP